jgi:ubiquinone/menaquinone biosynthesis C-methylase UbiE
MYQEGVEFMGWLRRAQKVGRYLLHGDLRSLKQEINQYLTWKAQIRSRSSFQYQNHRYNSHLALLQRLYSRPVFDLGRTGNQRLSGIFSPIYDQSVVEQYLHTQFLEHAKVYAEKYHAINYFRALISKAFQRTTLPQQGLNNLTILDIGSGAGNSIFPLLKLCPNSLIIASDLSVEMLVLLKDVLVAQKADQNCSIFQLNAEELDFKPGSIDVVVGAAVLHHLFAPKKTIEGCARVLKPGGYAIFFEPFEAGYSQLQTIYEAILDDPRHETLSEEVKTLLRALINDIIVRKGDDKSPPIYSQIDDKWLFKKDFFQKMIQADHFSECMIYPLHSTEHQFENQTVTFLRLGIGKEPDILPEWAWDIIRQYDLSLTDDVKNELLIEGCIILKK